MKTVSKKHLIIAPVLFTIFLFSLADASEQWRKITYPYFTIISQAGDKDTRKLASEFIFFINMMKEVIPVDNKFLPPLTIILFKHESGFSPYKPDRPDGKKARFIGGFFSMFDTWSIIGMTRGFGNDDSRRMIFNVGVHWYMSASRKLYPLWFSAGMGEVFSTFRYKKGKITWGHAIDNHHEWLVWEDLLPIRELVKITRNDDTFNDGYKTGFFYSQSWAFMHYLLFDNSEGSFPQSRHFRDSLPTLNIYKMFRKLSADDYKQIDQEFRSYIMRGLLPFAEIETAAFTLSDTASTIEDATEQEVSTALTKLAMGTQIELAYLSAQKMTSSYPDLPDGYDLLTLVMARKHQLDSTLIFAEKAINLNSTNANTYYLLVNSLLDKSSQISSDTSRNIANLLKKSLTLNPCFLNAQVLFSRVTFSLRDSCTKDDLSFLERAIELYPDEPEIILGIAAAHKFAGDNTKALNYIEIMEDMSASLPPPRKRDLDSLKLDLYKTCYKSRIDSLLLENKIDSAIFLIDKLQKGSPSLKAQLSDWNTDLLKINYKARIDELVSAKNIDAAILYIDEWLKKRVYPPLTKQFVEWKMKLTEQK